MMMEVDNLAVGGLGEDTIVAVSTPPGEGGIAVIRMSGSKAIDILAEVWKGVNPHEFGSHTAHLGKILDENGEVLDEVVATLFRAPNSFTGEDVVEISCHGSKWLQREICNLLIRKGARAADAGEYTRRAFINGKLDLAQAEGVADLIAASSRAAHRLAIQQTSGTYSRHIGELREKLITLASLLELELDFSEEDVEFANRDELLQLATEVKATVDRLAASYADGKVLKEGVPVVIAGAPNAGKSSLLNALLNDDKAIVTDIPGTTRDIIEDTRTIDGVLFRFIDTAGLRETDDTVEQIGIDRARARLRQARAIIWMIDATNPAEYEATLENIYEITGKDNTTEVTGRDYTSEVADEDNTAETAAITHILFFNKTDLFKRPGNPNYTGTAAVEAESESIKACLEGIKEDLEINKKDLETIKKGLGNTNLAFINLFGSVKTGAGIPELEQALLSTVSRLDTDTLTVTNARHYASLTAASASLSRVLTLLTAPVSDIYATPDSDHFAAPDSDRFAAPIYATPELIAYELREAIHHLGTITGAITTDTLLSTIFTRFCIGK